MIVDVGDHGGVARLLERLMVIYNVPTREQALARGIAIASALASYADQEGNIRLVDRSRPHTRRPVTLSTH